MKWREGAVPGSDLGTARFETFLRRLFGVKGIVAPAVEPKLQAGLDLLTPPWQLADTALLMGWRGYQAYYDIAAVAAQYGRLQVQNPVGSGVIAVVQFWELYPTGTAYGCFGELIPGTLFGGATVVQRTRLDSRGTDPLTLTGTCTVTQGTGVGTPAYLSRFRAIGTAGSEYQFDGPYIITPGYAFEICNGGANSGCRINVRWWERVAEPSELAAR